MQKSAFCIIDLPKRIGAPTGAFFLIQLGETDLPAINRAFSCRHIRLLANSARQAACIG